ncbi:hypothetical protein AA103196_0032 [Ameyamaea chiangmaiensis NBRC 103196]|uniref:DUF2484 family protein n=1 Tax=Ameyamaea chiangmaiensis TaxID=442969 RepID=A0A850PB05_9PROT|nr:hypothetical protein [Ameyamaea chiangmaiensis]MBS4076009.1 hypothetical protein [Ameyamaea chiangmaiensis]NVN40123.1 hypothetical protein [Ameyamaea chiangmaiensis]GBQ61467.1 hypothetical protein AA103196_0032 [Ameyamaea chiangmaiensis NBRC 103196]
MIWILATALWMLTFLVHPGARRGAHGWLLIALTVTTMGLVAAIDGGVGIVIWLGVGSVLGFAVALVRAFRGRSGGAP